MSERRRSPDVERRLRRAADTAASRQAPDPSAPGDEQDDDVMAAARRRRAENQAKWADLQVRQAMARGDFDNLPGAGKPLQGLGGTHDPEWWVKGLIEREKITGVGPPALALRKEDAELDARLDRETTAKAVRRLVEDFNARIVEARRQLLGGPPVITPLRDVEREVTAWQERRAQRRAERRAQHQAQVVGREPGVSDTSSTTEKRRWWRVRRWA
ncbi:MAG: hypothetical protein K0Q93_804 [Nocardioidaceae bacterium]|nr:hypothetical protein [Nocardioidaceae bacterium]